jgi:ATP phosphoribosyltransferase
MERAPGATIRLALPSKGHLYEGIIELLKTAGYKVRRASDRQYEATIVGYPRFHVVFMRPADIVIQVQEGRCHLGVTGMDVFREHTVESDQAVVVIPDLGYGGCRLAVAVPESWIDVSHVMDLVDLTTEFKAAGRTFRVSTKYPALVRQYFRKLGIYYYQLIPSEGALELHPSLGIADIIVDLTSSGTTLKDNRLRELEGGSVLESAACLIGHAPSLAQLVAEGEAGPLAVLLDAIDGVRGAEGWLHLEVVGNPTAPGFDTVEHVVGQLRARGASHIVRGEVWDDRGAPAWRVTALLPASKLVACQRALFRLGAGRVVGIPPRILFDRDTPSTFDDLRRNVRGPRQAAGDRFDESRMLQPEARVGAGTADVQPEETTGDELA